MTNAKIEAVLFDWGGTLATWHDISLHDTWRAVTTVLHTEQLNTEQLNTGNALDVDELAARLVAAEGSVWRRSRDEHRSSTLEEVCALAGVVLSPAALAEYERQWDPHTVLEPDALETLAALRSRGLKVGVLSNTIWPRRRHEEVFARDGVLELLDGAVYTSEIAHTKPHPEAFLAAMRAVGVAEPSRCLFVGDRLFDDVWGAQNVGMRAAHLPHSAIPTEQIGHTEGTPDATVQRLSELIALVDTWNETAA
ncbi:HAD family hydrolase [Kribbella sp. NPDC004875]|uniref:HAD family hydrolase n=1 Tax=Kribbella sp. NPDC004875 TaxID=3364107 RepID=UPI0036A0A91A